MRAGHEREIPVSRVAVAANVQTSAAWRYELLVLHRGLTTLVNQLTFTCYQPDTPITWPKHSADSGRPLCNEIVYAAPKSIFRVFRPSDAGMYP